ncbi:MAG: histidine phosphatase family protein [Thermoplasmataceae archaeon]
MAKAYVIRHAEVVVDPNFPLDQWDLSPDPEAETSIRQISRGIEGTTASRIYHSPENKARNTAKFITDILGISMETSFELREVERTFRFLPDDVFNLLITEYLEGKGNGMFEDYKIAQNRVTKCFSNIVSKNHGRDVILVSHGLILTILYSNLLHEQLNRIDWKAIKIPDLSIIDLDKNTIERGFFSGKDKKIFIQLHP